MTTRMLIDARHQEETRVAVLKGNRIEEFDFESADHKQIKGNIYLAKVTRVEPSLQAAFVDYGGNRHGFLAFSEIHPDYYQIPREDREALLAEEARAAEEEAAARAVEEEEEDRDPSSRDDNHDDDDIDFDEDDSDSSTFAEELAEESGVVDGDDDPIEAENLSVSTSSDDDDDEATDNGNANRRGKRGGPRRQRGRAKASDEARQKRMALRRRYKIQDVIHRRQVLLVQVVKEERGNKGAALTTYLSLAGRYCVLMPNSSHGGGISRKISNAGDRKRLKSIISDLSLPASMGCIVRTAGLSRTKTEIKRDFDYLARLWDEIREKTLSASAPENIHSDSDLIKRAIRDIYNRDIEEVLVEGEAGYRAAKDFMKLLMPSHARRVQSYSDPVPLFQRYGAEDQLSAMYEPVVQLKSGGYLVINPTEALVSIDINSGRSTKEHGIEATAISTNLEAAREIARQLRLRDMAGLVVIDFIDMDYGSNVRKVEKAMRDALKSDRARIQVGRISGFGLMEMSRQRLRTGVLEASTRTCPHCDGTGLVRTASSAGLSALRMLEEEAAKGRGSVITLRTSHEATIYVLNNKRRDLAEVEERYGVSIEILPNGDNEGAKMEVSSAGPKPEKTVSFEPIIDDDDYDDLPEEAEEEREDARPRNDDEAGGRSKRRRRRRGKRNRGDRPNDSASDNTGESGDEADESDAPQSDSKTRSEEGDDGETKPKRARRGRRGGRRSRNTQDNTEQTEGQDDTAAPADDDGDSSTQHIRTSEAAPPITSQDASPEADKSDAKPKRRPSRAKKAVAEAPPAEATQGEASEAPSTDKPEEAEPIPAKPKRKPRRKAGEAKAEPAPAETAQAESPESPDEPKPAAKRRAPAKRKPAAKKDPAPARSSEKMDVAAEQQSEPAPVQSAPASKDNNDKVAVRSAADNDQDESKGGARKGWWQRTFGN